MNCSETRDNLELYVLGGLDRQEAESVRQHLSICTECRNKEEQYWSLVGRIREISRAQTGKTFSKSLKLVLESEIEGARKQRRIISIAAVVLSAAAAIAITVSVWFILQATEKKMFDKPISDARAATYAGSDLEKWHYSGAKSHTASVAEALVAGESCMYLLRDSDKGTRVAAISADTGALQWESKIESLGYLATDKSRVLCIAADSTRTLDLVALDTDGGKELWRCSQPVPRRAAGLCRPVILKNNRACWINHTDVNMLDLKTGGIIWSRTIAGEGSLSPAAVSGDSLYIVTGRGFHCLELKTGSESWAKMFDRDTRGHNRPLLSICRDRAFFCQSRLDSTSRLFCMDLPARKLLWDRPVEETAFLSASKKQVLMRGRRIESIDGNTGKTLWTCAAEGCGPVTTAGNRVYFVDSGKQSRLVALKMNTGRKLWSIPGIRSCDGFALLGDTGFIKTTDGIVHAFSLSDVK